MRLLKNKITIIFILVYSVLIINLFAQNGKFRINSESDTLQSDKNCLINELITKNRTSPFSSVYYYKHTLIGRNGIMRIIKETGNPTLIRSLNKYKSKQNRFSIICVSTLLGCGALYLIGSLNHNTTLMSGSIITGSIITIPTAIYAQYCKIYEFDDIVDQYNLFISKGTSVNSSIFDKSVRVGLLYHFK